MADNVNIPSAKTFSEGLEDIRLFVDNLGNLSFIATTVNYSPTGRNRMIIGKYDIEKHECRECKIVDPPGDSWCEKNWVPIQQKPDPFLCNDVFFIYKFFPFEIGRLVNDETNERLKLEIVKSKKIPGAWFNKIRGSSVFIEEPRGLIGIVHFSEEGSPRHYYHILMLLDRVTKEPLKYSEIFYFDKIGVEFCIGFTILEKDARYCFWISQEDRDAKMVSVPIENIPLKFDII